MKKKMLVRKEKVQDKLNSMANLLLDDILKPHEIMQSGEKSITAGWYDENDNRFDFTLTIKVSPTLVEEDGRVYDPVTGDEEL